MMHDGERKIMSSLPMNNVGYVPNPHLHELKHSPLSSMVCEDGHHIVCEDGHHEEGVEGGWLLCM